jgi:hypothetical protein
VSTTRTPSIPCGDKVFTSLTSLIAITTLLLPDANTVEVHARPALGWVRFGSARPESSISVAGLSSSLSRLACSGEHVLVLHDASKSEALHARRGYWFLDSQFWRYLGSSRSEFRRFDYDHQGWIECGGSTEIQQAVNRIDDY